MNKPDAPDTLLISTELGDFEILLFKDLAPYTTSYFSNLTSQKALDNSSVFRILTGQNSEIRSNTPIHVIQMGIESLTSEHSSTFKHESTNITGLTHRKWIVSAARFDATQNYPSFFICMRDEPELDFGGKRHPDGLGFAAFGEVINGYDCLDLIYSQAEKTELIKNKIRILSIR